METTLSSASVSHKSNLVLLSNLGLSPYQNKTGQFQFQLLPYIIVYFEVVNFLIFYLMASDGLYFISNSLQPLLIIFVKWTHKVMYSAIHIYQAYNNIVDLFYRAENIVDLLTCFRVFLNIFQNILTPLCRVYNGSPRNVGPRIDRGCFQHRPTNLVCGGGWVGEIKTSVK